MSHKKLTEKVIIEGVIKAETGIHIGGTNTAMSIGGIDKTVVRNPVTQKPYIPGSSLKGKMRSLLEIANGWVEDNNMGKVRTVGSSDPDKSQAAKIFGTARGDERQRPSRIIVRDGDLMNEDDLKSAELLYTEAKTEVVIDRITSAANPRTNERVPAGAEFKLSMVVNIFEGDDRANTLKYVWQSLKMLQDDYIGGNGSRGYGQIGIRVDKVKTRSVAYYLTGQGESIITNDCGLPAELQV